MSFLRTITRRLPVVANRLPSIEMLFAPGQQKYLLDWFKSRRKNYLLDHAIPWIVYDAANYLRRALGSGIRVFEYGSGASTLFWARFGAHVVSIEHDAEWVAALRPRFPPGYDIELRWVPPDAEPIPSSGDLADPNSYRTNWVGMEEHFTFRNYVSQIDSFADAAFDVVMVDGHARPSCLMHSYRKVKPGGMLILDNADVPYYLERTLSLLNAFERLSFRGIAPIHGVLSQTDVFIRRQ